MERRKDKRRRKLAKYIPILILFCRKKKDPKEIGKIIKKPSWWVRRQLCRFK